MNTMLYLMIGMILLIAITWSVCTCMVSKWRHVATLKLDRDKLADELEVKQKDMRTTEYQLEQVKKALANYSSRMEEYDRINAYVKDRESLLAESEALQREISERTNTLSSLLNDVKDKQDRVDALRKLQAELGAVEKQLNEAKGLLNGVTQDLTSRRIERDNFMKNFEDAKKEWEDVKQNNDKLKLENHSLSNDKADLEKQVRKFEQILAESKQALEQNRDKLLALENIDGKLKILEEQIKGKEKHLSDLTASIEKVMAQVKAGLDRLERMNLTGIQTLRLASFKELRVPVFLEQGIRAEVRAHTDEESALASVRKHLKDSGFNVPDRLLYAFHTSLKASEMSSLTVMAGVSGTGKSALPKLYAEAMGICFQPLAVEPRWDSPKDLLGFFNYVTNHYEPTMLARAFLQFQGVHPSGYGEDFRPVEDLSEYMFMPLLDEMNLARIEYYFSEFLSKLEMRRLQGDLTFENSRPVSLELFQGFDGIGADGKKVTESPIRLLANTNTLFVGTMNEDETTQSLSDKVIDRANVLYFGRPAKLEASAAAAARVHTKKRSYLPKTTWESWLHPISDVPEVSGVQEKLTNLNMALAGLNRPFAHRTYQAILSYVANYPEDDQLENRVNRALADQIGMRIMPKLRGLDLRQNQEIFENVGSIVTELGDLQLSQAFRDACDLDKNHSGFFQWSGFDWSQDDNA